jgi:hypothetical protein
MAERGDPTGLVQFIPRAGFRESFPRRDREDYIEALTKELGLSEGMVMPERFKYDYGDYRRPAIKLPEVYATGGSTRRYKEGGLGTMDRITETSRGPQPIRPDTKKAYTRLTP